MGQLTGLASGGVTTHKSDRDEKSRISMSNLKRTQSKEKEKVQNKLMIRFQFLSHEINPCHYFQKYGLT